MAAPIWRTEIRLINMQHLTVLLGTSSMLALCALIDNPALAQSGAQLPPVTVEGSAPKPQTPAATAPPKAPVKAVTARVAQPKPAPKPKPQPVVAQPASPPPPTEIVSTSAQQAQKAASQAAETPLATQTTGQEIRANEISSFTDLGNTTEPGVEFSTRTDSPSIRGLEGPRVATVIDGITIPFLENSARASTATNNLPTNADGGATAFDFFSISALDVLRGADSSRIGSGALGGAIVLRTLEPEDLITHRANWGALAKTTYDSRDRSIGGGIALAARHGGLSVLLQGSYVQGHEVDNRGENGAYGAARTKPKPLDFDQQNILFKLRHTSTSGHRLGVTAERYRRDVDADLATNWNRTAAQSGYNPGNYFGQEFLGRERVSLDYSYSAPFPGLIKSAFATAYWMNLDKASGADGTQRNGTYYLRDVDLGQETIGLVAGVNGNVRTGDLKHDWRVGLDASTFTATQYTTILPATAFGGRSQADIPKVDGAKFGIYVDNRMSFTGSRFALTPGIRFDWHEYRPKEDANFTVNPGSGVFDFPGNNTGSRVTPKILATYKAADRLELFAQWAAAYRAPTVNELYSNFTNLVTGYAQLGNADLKPETGHGIEIGANFGDRAFGGRVTAFHNWYRNFIVAGDLTPDPAFPQLPFGVGRYENIDEVKLTGVEFKAHMRFLNGFRLHGGLAYTYGEDGDGNLLPTVAPIKGIAGIGYDTMTWGVDLTGIFVGKYRDDFADPARVDTTFDAKGYAIANLSAWWEPSFFKGLRIQGAVKNLFDTTYYDALALRNVNLAASASQPLEFYSSPGRSFLLSATQKF